MKGPPPNHESLRRGVELRRERKRRWDLEGERPLVRNLALAGSIGWLIVVPTLAGLFLGRWLDRSLETGITMTAALLFLGVAAGCVMAWQRVKGE